MDRSIVALRLLISTCALLGALLACDEHAASRSERREIPPDRASAPPAIDLSPWPGDGAALERISLSGRHRVFLRPTAADLDRARHHAWEIHVATMDGMPVPIRRLRFAASMPAHGHGLPGIPRVAGISAGGWTRVRGVRFHMGGHWQIRVQFEASQGGDVAIFEIDVPY